VGVNDGKRRNDVGLNDERHFVLARGLLLHHLFLRPDFQKASPLAKTIMASFELNPAALDSFDKSLFAFREPNKSTC
jgi:hypothetical protein